MNLIPIAITVLLSTAALPGAPRTAVAAPAATEVSAAPGWRQTGDMLSARVGHTATLLWNGKVLVVGGSSDDTAFGFLDSAELYDPPSGTWSSTGALSQPASGHTATLLPDGKVLVAGGTTLVVAAGINTFPASAAAQVYDPATGVWTSTGSMLNARSGHTATLLQSGKVLVAGGFGDSSFVSDAELYDPQSGTWSPAGRLPIPRWLHSATRLQDGIVLVAGGSDDPDYISPMSSVEIYDPVAGSWSEASALALPRYDHGAVLMPDGRLMVAGGWGSLTLGNGSVESTTLNSTELYDPSTRRWTATSPLPAGQAETSASALLDGTILVAGGSMGGSGSSIEFATATYRYHPDSATWTSAGDLHAGRNGHTATVLANGDVLVAGGRSGFANTPSATAEIYAAGSTPGVVNPDQHGLTGSWANPATSGQGLVMEVYPDLDGPGRGALFGGWFTYDTTAAGGQRWYTIQGDVDTNAPVAMLSIYQSVGGAFASAQATTTTQVGHATLRFGDCTQGAFAYQFSDGSGRAGTIPLSRLLPNVSCAPAGDNGVAASSYLLSGAWADARNNSGQGLVLDVNPLQNVLFAAWYTFANGASPSGGAAGQHWYTLQARMTPGTSRVDEIGIYDTHGGQFDRPASTNTVAVGRASLVFHDCGSATLSYQFDAGRNGTLELARVGPTPQGCSL